MGLESATYIADLVETNPLGGDGKSAGDDHLRLIKEVLKNSFPAIDAAVTATPTELNALVGLSDGNQWGSVTLGPGWAALNTPFLLKISSHLVVVGGVVWTPLGTGSQSVIFTLPVGFRPTGTAQNGLATYTRTGTTRDPAYLHIANTGAVSVVPNGSSAVVAGDSVYFLAAIIL